MPRVSQAAVNAADRQTLPVHDDRLGHHWPGRHALEPFVQGQQPLQRRKSGVGQAQDGGEDGADGHIDGDRELPTCTFSPRSQRHGRSEHPPAGGEGRVRAERWGCSAGPASRWTSRWKAAWDGTGTVPRPYRSSRSA